MSGSLYQTINYLVPATGSTSSWILNEALQANVPVIADWAQISQNGERFTPSGFYVAPHALAGGVKIRVIETGFEIVVPPNTLFQMMYPAPLVHRIEISSPDSGPVNVSFVNYPVIPYAYEV